MSSTFQKKLFLFFSQKGVDKSLLIVYNIIRSGEERKTLGPTANLPIFKMYVQLNSAGHDISVPN